MKSTYNPLKLYYILQCTTPLSDKSGPVQSLLVLQKGFMRPQ